MLNRIRALCVPSLFALLGCSGSDGPNNAPPSPSEAGAPSTSGGSGSAGSANPPAHGGSGNGGTAPIFGVSGSGGSTSGGSATASAPGVAGSAGAMSAAAGLGGSPSGSAGASAGAGGSGRGPAPTFTTIYNTIITPNCGGAQCHLKRPTPFGYDFSSKSAASSSWRADVIAGNADDSPMFQVLNLAIMPKDKPPLSIEQLFMIYDWINAGALDN